MLEVATFVTSHTRYRSGHAYTLLLELHFTSPSPMVFYTLRANITPIDPPQTQYQILYTSATQLAICRVNHLQPKLVLENYLASLPTSPITVLLIQPIQRRSKLSSGPIPSIRRAKFSKAAIQIEGPLSKAQPHNPV